MVGVATKVKREKFMIKWEIGGLSQYGIEKGDLRALLTAWHPPLINGALNYFIIYEHAGC